ncbi:MAG: bifunctional riboflavin kinase/FAD synthetase [Lachnospiraceae bacterium]|nr:bifunctional riboflavin kinase/FAD synthetase [Lachnospiraceae bacterium]
MTIYDYDSLTGTEFMQGTVCALGKFEGMHLGHRMLVERTVKEAAKRQLGSLVFAINMPGRQVINLMPERARIISELGVEGLVECAFSDDFKAMEAEEFVEKVLIRKLRAKVVVCGTDFCFGSKRRGDVELLKRYSDAFSLIAYEKLKEDGREISSSLIREELLKGAVDEAGKLLGRPYAISGVVREGKKLGRTIGFPTINLIPEKDKLLPGAGVYETLVSLDGRDYRSLTNVGSNPTVSDEGVVTVESHLLRFHEDAYGKPVTVSFLRQLRKEIKFKSLEELKKQIEFDKIELVSRAG